MVKRGIVQVWTNWRRRAATAFLVSMGPCVGFRRIKGLLFPIFFLRSLLLQSFNARVARVFSYYRVESHPQNTHTQSVNILPPAASAYNIYLFTPFPQQPRRPRSLSFPFPFPSLFICSSTRISLSILSSESPVYRIVSFSHISVLPYFSHRVLDAPCNSHDHHFLQHIIQQKKNHRRSITALYFLTFVLFSELQNGCLRRYQSFAKWLFIYPYIGSD